MDFFKPEIGQEVKVVFEKQEFDEKWHRHYYFFKTVDGQQVARVASKFKRDYELNKEYTLITKSFVPRGRTDAILYAAIKEDDKSITK